MSKKAFIERVANRGKISKAEAETIRTSNAKIRELTSRMIFCQQNSALGPQMRRTMVERDHSRPLSPGNAGFCRSVGRVFTVPKGESPKNLGITKKR